MKNDIATEYEVYELLMSCYSEADLYPEEIPFACAEEAEAFERHEAFIKQMQQ